MRFAWFVVLNVSNRCPMRPCPPTWKNQESDRLIATAPGAIQNIPMCHTVGAVRDGRKCAKVEPEIGRRWRAPRCRSGRGEWPGRGRCSDRSVAGVKRLADVRRSATRALCRNGSSHAKFMMTTWRMSKS